MSKLFFAICQIDFNFKSRLSKFLSMSLVSFLLSATVTWLAQSNAILKKNFISLYKKPAFVLFAILSPCLGPIILAACFIAIPASGSSSQFQVDYTQSIPFSLDTCPDNCPFIYYTPTTSKHDKIMSILAAANPTLKIGVNIIPCTNELDMSSKIINNQNMIFNYFYAGVSFTDKNTSVLTAYSIWEKESTYNSPYQSQTYALQNQLDSAIISFTTNKPSSSNAILKFFTPQGTKRTYETKAKSGYSGPNVANLFTSTLSTVILPFFFFPILSLSLTIVATEKRLKLLHPLRIMGLFESAYWVSNLIPINSNYCGMLDGKRCLCYNN